MALQPLAAAIYKFPFKFSTANSEELATFTQIFGFVCGFFSTVEFLIPILTAPTEAEMGV